MNKEELYKLRTIYESNPIMDIKGFEDKEKSEIQMEEVTDKELLEMINSPLYKQHPVFPVIVDRAGKKVYDIRSNLSLVIKNNNPISTKRRSCYVAGYGRIAMCKMIAEAWHNVILNDDINVHHIDGNKRNDDIDNLKIMNYIEHDKLHGKSTKRAKIIEKIADKKTLVDIRKKTKKIYNYKIRNVSKPNNLKDSDILFRINSCTFKLHPKYPIIINQDGKHIYDIRNNSKILPAHNICVIPMYGPIDLSRLVIEAWSNKLLKATETVCHSDKVVGNNNYKNLVVLKNN